MQFYEKKKINKKNQKNVDGIQKKKKIHRDTTNLNYFFELETIVPDYLFCVCQFRIVESDV